jgi:maleate isomerase
MESDATAAAMLLSDADVDIICYACTSGSFYRGMKHEHELAAELKERSGIPVVTTSQAVLLALESLRSKKIVVCTPYTQQINEKLRKFFVENGLVLADLRELGLVENTEIGRLPPEAAYNLVRGADTRHAQAVFLSCTNLRTIEVVERLENELHLPVTSSNIATFWYALRFLGHEGSIEGLGELLRNVSLHPPRAQDEMATLRGERA